MDVSVVDRRIVYLLLINIVLCLSHEREFFNAPFIVPLRSNLLQHIFL